MRTLLLALVCVLAFGTSNAATPVLDCVRDADSTYIKIFKGDTPERLIGDFELWKKQTRGAQCLETSFFVAPIPFELWGSRGARNEFFVFVRFER